MEISRPQGTVDLFKLIARFFELLNENKLLITVTLIACLGLGTLAYVLLPKNYESKMIIQSDILSESYSLRVAENLNQHIYSKDYEVLAAKLNMSVEDVPHLVDFRVSSALTPMSQQMDEEDKIIVVISVRVDDNGVLPKLEQGIVYYLSTNEYIKRRVDERRKKFQGLVNALDREIKMMDTLKQKISKGTISIGKSNDVSLVDVSGLYEVAADLYEKMYDFEIELATVDSIQIVEGLAPFKKPVWPKLSLILTTSLVFAGFIIMGLIGFRSFKNQSQS